MARKGKVELVPIQGPAAVYLLGIRPTGGQGPLCPVLRDRSKVSDGYITILKEAGIDVGVVDAAGEAGHRFSTKSFHSWRHTLSSRLAEAGVDQRIGKLIVGHENDKVHADFTHFGLEKLAEAMAKAAK